MGRVKQALGATRHWFAASPTRVWVVIFAVYALVRLLLIISGHVFEAPDSAVYAPREDPSRNHGPLLSFVGDAPRPPGPLAWSDALTVAMPRDPLRGWWRARG